MPHYDPEHAAEVEPRDAVAVVHAFLERCIDWAERKEIPRRMAELSDEPRAERVAALHAWVAYREFTAYALHELETGQLDRWFDPSAPTDEER